jgi:ketosteroid isomerase-like protein
MKKILVAVIFTLSISLPVFAQKTDDAKDALAVVNKMFDEMAAHNPAAIAALYTPESNLAAIFKTKDRKTVIRSFTGEAFSKNFAEKKGEIKEDMYAPEVKVYGDLALVFGRYVFYVDGKLSHCGVNAFHLVRTDAGWRIANASSTIDPQDCTEQEKAMKPPTVTPTATPTKQP